MNVKNISPGVYLKPNIPTLNLLNTYILVFKKVKISSIFDRNLKIGTMKHILLFIMLTTITGLSVDILQIQNDSIGHVTIPNVTIPDSGSGRHIGPGRQSDRKNFHDRSALYAHLCSRRRQNLPDG